MAIRYSSTIIGTFTLAQPRRVFNTQTGKYELVKDDKGRQVYNEYKIQIREANCLMCAIRVFKEENPQDPKRPWCHDLVSFFNDIYHMKRCLKKGGFEYWFSGRLKNIKLNVYYKEMQTLMKYMVKDGLQVKCYYKEPKKK